MLKKLFMLAVAGGIAGLAVFWFITIPAVVPASALAAYTPNVANGEMVFNIGGCASCHAVKGEARTALGGGYEIKSDFGTFYAPNISPHNDNGIGKWTEAEFVTAVAKGTSPSGEHYYPAFPYTSYTHGKIDDVRDLFAYIKTLPPVSGKVRDHDVKFPFNIRRLVGGWKFLFFDDGPFIGDASKSASWNRGKYLVNGFGHCAECHSPRNLIGGIVSSQRLAGGPDPDHPGGWVPNITQAGKIKEWSVKDIASFLSDGTTPDGDTAGGSMAHVIRNTALLSNDDRAAIAEYLKSLPPIDGPPRPPKKKT